MKTRFGVISGPLRAIFGIVVPGLALGACAAPPSEFVVVERPCYRTLARVDCHAMPLPGESGRRVGYFDWSALGVAASDRVN